MQNVEIIGTTVWRGREFIRRRERDYQRSKVYEWERQEFGWDTDLMSLEDCAALAKEIRPDVRVLDGRRRRGACAVPAEGSIKLPRLMRKKWVVLHEVAHLLCYDGKVASHGRQFMADYIDLLARYYRRDKDAIWQSALAFGLRVGY